MKVFAPWFSGVLLGLSVQIVPGQVNSLSDTNRFQFRTPQPQAYRIEQNEPRLASARGGLEWLKTRLEGSTNFVEFGRRVVVQLQSPDDLARLTAGHPLELARVVGSNIFILQAPDALTAAGEAQRLAALPEVLASYPVLRQQADLNGPYAPLPSDSLFFFEWPLEHRNADGSSAGVDLNVRAAWPYTIGEGVTIAVADTGVELNHPELIANVTGAPHYNFPAQNTNGAPINRSGIAAHGTEVAGLAVADLNHARMAGVAPGASLASWVIFDPALSLATDEQLMDMYQYALNIVSVENHSWGHVGLGLNGETLLEDVGISNAVNHGRAGRGVVLVRSAGNDRTSGANADDDGYPADPRVIAVAAVRMDGRVTSYSEPGACVLVGAPSGDFDTIPSGLFTTDLLGTDGANVLNFFPPYQDLSGYVFNSLGFSGTSASAPQIAGVAALVLSANPSLTYRDVQQILIFASRHFDFADPDLATNGAGFLVSHSVGFGVPDAGVAVNLARSWINRPPLTNVTVTSTKRLAIPDDGLRVEVSGAGVPESLKSIHTLPSTGPHADVPTPRLPLADVGRAVEPITVNLTNKGALILRGGTTFASKISFAAQAGAAFAIVYNYSTNVDSAGGDGLVAMGGTDFVPIPAVFIGNSDGVALQAFFQPGANKDRRARIRLQSVNQVFDVSQTLICEHVGVRVKTDHPLRGDLRITLLSPAGTRSVLQRYNNDTSPGPVDWTYYSVHHFFESSAGHWTVSFSDEAAGNTGSVQFVSLTIDGVPIRDRDHDGLDDTWEMEHFHSLKQGPRDDPDHDGYSNMREQIMGTDPNAADVPFQLDLSFWNQDRARLSWPGSPDFNYEVWGGTNGASLNLITTLPGLFPVTEWFAPVGGFPNQFFRVRAIPKP